MTTNTPSRSLLNGRGCLGWRHKENELREGSLIRYGQVTKDRRRETWNDVRCMMEEVRLLRNKNGSVIIHEAVYNTRGTGLIMNHLSL